VDNFQVSTSIPVSLTVLSSIFTQDLELIEGYRFVSTRISPNDPEMTSVVAEIMNDNLQYIRNSAGAMLRKIGPVWVNSIGDMQPCEGYLVKMASDASLIYPEGGKSVNTNRPLPKHFEFEGEMQPSLFIQFIFPVWKMEMK